MSFLDRGHAHTNASLRKLLGESGYLQDGEVVSKSKTETASLWRRGSDKLWLIETLDSKNPYLQEAKDGGVNIINPKTLGVRNPNIQQDGSADE